MCSKGGGVNSGRNISGKNEMSHLIYRDVLMFQFVFIWEGFCKVEKVFRDIFKDRLMMREITFMVKLFITSSDRKKYTFSLKINNFLP